MDKLVADRDELPDSESCEDEELPEEPHVPPSVLVTHSGKRRVMELQDRPRAKKCETPPMLLSRDAVTHIRRAARRCPGGPESLSLIHI